MTYNQTVKKIREINFKMYKYVASSLILLLSILSTSCGISTKFFGLIVSEEDNQPARERISGGETDIDKKSLFDLLRINIYLDNFLLNETTPVIRIEGVKAGASLKLKEGSCSGEVRSSLDHDGTFEGLLSYEDYREIQYYVELNYQGGKECQALEKSWVHLENITVSYNEVQTSLDKRKPQFNVVNLFPEKEVKVSLYENSTCSGESLSQIISTTTGSTVVGLANPLSDLNTHTYYVKQSYKGVSICSSVGVDYTYNLEIENLELSYDEVILEGSEGSVEVDKVLPGSTVTLHKGSCEAPVDDSITKDGELLPTTTNIYTDIPLYVKYTYDQTSVCSEIESRYVFLEEALLSLNSAETDLHKRRPTFDVTNLYPGKNVTITLYETANCSGEVVSGIVNSDTGSAIISISSDINDNNTHTYYAKQSIAGVANCSEGVQYTYGLDISDLTITSDPILYGENPASISVSGMIPGSSVSIHKGSCNAVADDSISEDGTLTPIPTNTHTEVDLYLKYSLNQGSSCQSIGVQYLNLVAPVLALNSAQTNLDRRSPKFNVTSLFTGKNVTVTLHESSDCSGIAVSDVVNSNTGSGLLSLSSALTDINSHTYSVKQSYLGHTSCSNTLAYQYSIDTANLGIVVDDILFGETPGSVMISKMLSGSTVSLHKGSCESLADDSISSDGSLTPVSIGFYDYSALYIKYTKGVESDCDLIDSHYLYLEQPILSLDSTETDQHPLTPTFNVTNLFSGKSVTVTLHEESDCSGPAVSSSVVSSSGSASISLSSALESTGIYEYFVKQSYLGYSTCSISDGGGVYNYIIRSIEYISSIPEYNKTEISGYNIDQNRGIVVKGTLSNNTIKVYEGNSCDNELNLLATTKTTHDVTLVHIPNITDGMHQFSFKEIDSESNVIDCYSTETVSYKTPAIYGNNTGFIHIHDNTVDYYGDTNDSQTFISSKVPKGVYSSGGAFAVLHADGSVTTYGNSLAGGDSSSVAIEIDGSIPVTAIYSNGNAFAALRSNGSVVTWGSASFGGNSSSVSSNLSSGVVRIFSNSSAFAALKSDGSVITWGQSGFGGNSSSVTSSLSSGVVSIFSTVGAFAALKSDGSVITWGQGALGGNSSSVSEQLSSGVVRIFSNSSAFAALKSDGSVITWGQGALGGNSSSVSEQLSSGVVRIFSTGSGGFAALKSNGSVVTWGNSANGGDSSLVGSLLSSGVVNIFSNGNAFVALKSDGSLVTWGDAEKGGDSSSVSSSISSGVVNVFSTTQAFVALKENASLVTWGYNSYGGDSSSVSSNISSGVAKVFSNGVVFAALKENGSVISWGSSSYGGDQGTAAPYLDGGISVIDIVGGTTSSFMALRADGSVVIWGGRSYTPPPLKIFSNNTAFAALKANGSVVTWGNSNNGGDSSSVASRLTSGVINIFSSSYGAFAALKEDGSVVTWGKSDKGGNSSSVSSSISSGVVKIFSNGDAFAALKEDGSVVTWGGGGGNSSSVASSLSSGVVSISSSYGAFAAVKSDGSVVAWGNEGTGGSTTSPVNAASRLTSGVVSIFSNGDAFAALKEDGSVVTWGSDWNGGNSSGYSLKLSSGVVDICSAMDAFVALKSDGSLVVWGSSNYVDDFYSVMANGVIGVFSTEHAFAALKSDGSVYTWGEGSGKDSSSVSSSLSSGVVNIFSNVEAFAALKSDGSVVTWGGEGGDSSSVSSSLSSGVVNIFSTGSAFAALKEDGTVVTWGNASSGGDSSGVDFSL